MLCKKHAAFFCLKRLEDFDIQELQLKKDNKRKSSIKKLQKVEIHRKSVKAT